MTKDSNDKIKWNERYSAVDSVVNVSGEANVIPALVLLENSHLLPRRGSALDLACGLGANAIFLAEHGLETSAWDISNVAISHLKQYAETSGLNIKTEARDVVRNPPTKNSFDVIVVSRFLDRKIIPLIIDALNPGGFVFYQTFTIDKQAGAGPNNPDFLLKPNELLQLFQSMTVRVYREEGLEGNQEKGFRNEAMLVAQKIAE